MPKSPIIKYTVIRDTREKEGKGWTFKSDVNCDGTIIQKLDTGDYSLLGFEKDFVIERKATTSEVATNIYEKRFEKELERLDDFKYPFIICEFSWDDVVMFPIRSGIPTYLYHKVKLTNEYLQNCFIKWQIQHKVKIIFAGNNGDIVAQKLFKYIAKYGIKSC